MNAVSAEGLLSHDVCTMFLTCCVKHFQSSVTGTQQNTLLIASDCNQANPTGEQQHTVILVTRGIYCTSTVSP